VPKGTASLVDSPLLFIDAVWLQVLSFFSTLLYFNIEEKSTTKKLYLLSIFYLVYILFSLFYLINIYEVILGRGSAALKRLRNTVLRDLFRWGPLTKILTAFFTFPRVLPHSRMYH
jgi:hypothetical protein